MAESVPLVPLPDTQQQPDSQPTSSSLSPSSSSSSESSAPQPTTGLRLRNIELKEPSSDVSFELDEKEKGKIQVLLNCYPNLEELKKLNLEKMKVDVKGKNAITDKKVLEASLSDGDKLVQTYSESYCALIMSLNEMKDKGENILNFLRQPIESCTATCQQDGTSAYLDRYLKGCGKGLEDLDRINTQYVLFQAAENNLSTHCAKQRSKSQHERPETYKRPQESWLYQICWTIWCWLCCCCPQRKT